MCQLMYGNKKNANITGDLHRISNLNKLDMRISTENSVSVLSI